MILIALGANISGSAGSPQETIIWAIREMTNYQISVKSVSSFYRTKAVGQRHQADYVNGVISVGTAMSAVNLLKNLKLLEQAAGRNGQQSRMSGRWGPRPLDLDIIDYKKTISQNFHFCRHQEMNTKGANLQRCKLVLPHPRAHLRPFVIRPIVDINPFWHHPVSGLSAHAMWRRMWHCREGRILHEIE